MFNCARLKWNNCLFTSEMDGAGERERGNERKGRLHKFNYSAFSLWLLCFGWPLTTRRSPVKYSAIIYWFVRRVAFIGCVHGIGRNNCFVWALRAGERAATANWFATRQWKYGEPQNSISESAVEYIDDLPINYSTSAKCVCVWHPAANSHVPFSNFIIARIDWIVEKWSSDARGDETMLFAQTLSAVTVRWP